MKKLIVLIATLCMFLACYLTSNAEPVQFKKSAQNKIKNDLQIHFQASQVTFNNELTDKKRKDMKDLMKSPTVQELVYTCVNYGYRRGVIISGAATTPLTLEQISHEVNLSIQDVVSLVWGENKIHVPLGLK